MIETTYSIMTQGRRISPHLNRDDYFCKKWVAVDDLIKKLNSICEHEAEDTYENDMEAMGLLSDFVVDLEKVRDDERYKMSKAKNGQ